MSGAVDLDIDRLAGILRLAAEREVLPRFRRLGDGDVRAKSEPSDLVTEADEAAERLIRGELQALAPSALIVGEEAAARDPGIIAGLSGAEFAIVVDPVDGTFNFAAGIPAFGIMAAVIRNGQTVAGLLFDPLGDDCVIAESGSGAFLKRADGQSLRLRVAAPQPLEAMIGAVSTSYFFGDERRRILSNLAKLRYFASYRCAAHEYRAFANGYLQFLIYKRLMPWDHLAGALVATEAGGYAARLDGSAYLPGHVDGGLLVASDRDSFEMLHREILTA